MGQVVHVAAMSATAMLITDASHAIPVQIDRTGLRAIAFGTGKMDQIDLRHLPHNVDIQVGDMVISSGLGGTFPPNYPVATITRVERPDGEPFAAIEAKPLAQLDTSREVLLIWHNRPEEKPEEMTEENRKEAADNKVDAATSTDDIPPEEKPLTSEQQKESAEDGDNRE
jgi:rod shape-determining protein MreC